MSSEKFGINCLLRSELFRIIIQRSQRKTWCMGPYAGVDYNLTYLLSRVDSKKFTLDKPMPESTLCQNQLYARVDCIPSQGLWIWPKNVLVENQVRLLALKGDMESFFLIWPQNVLVENQVRLLALKGDMEPFFVANNSLSTSVQGL
jgi:hypothetical protein